jgi:membrane protease YdiL (CAAX protease family)
VISHFLAFVLIIALPIWDRFETRRLKTSRDPRVKIQSYQMTIAWLWTCAVIAIAALGWKPLWTVQVNASEVRWLPAGINGSLGLALGVGFLAATLIPVLLVQMSAKLRAGFERQLAGLSFFLPATGEERLWFGLVSVSAGVCEEILFRGFLIRYFQAGPYHLALALALVLSCLFFGTAHLYQGIVGVLQTTLMGLIFAALFLLTGSLVLPVLAHVATDLRLLLILRKAPQPS